MCAMRTGAGDTDAYLAEWRKADPIPVGDDLEAEADESRWPTSTRNTTGSGWSPWSRRAARTMAEPRPRHPGHAGQAGGAEVRLQAGRRVAAAARAALLHDPPVVGAPFARARMVLRPVRRHLPDAASAVEGHRLRPRRGAGEVRREAGQGLHVRLPHVRPVHPVLDRHVVPDELPQAAAQRSLRRRARQRQLRGRAGHALRLGQGLGRLAQHGQGRRHPGRAEAGRPVAARDVRLAAGDRASRGGARNSQGEEQPDERQRPPPARREPGRHRICRSIRCPATPRAAGWSACCGAASSP